MPMSDARKIENKTKELIMPILDKASLRLVDVEYVKEGEDYYLRVYIDKDGGVNIDDCVEVSRAFNPVLDSENYISDQYIFEVSSPGADRVLKKDGDLEFALGKTVLIKTYKKLSGKKEFEGVLEEWNDDELLIMNAQGDRITFQRKDISLVCLKFDYENDLNDNPDADI